MQYNDPKDTILPEDFDGVFKFTNPSDEDFIGKWNKVEYTFKANTTSPMIMNFTPVEIQNIRKKFAKELAVREFYKTGKFSEMNKHTPGGTPPTYTDNELTELIQKCLKPLPIAQAKARVTKTKSIEDINSRDEEGNLRTEVLDSKKSLVKEGSTILKD